MEPIKKHTGIGVPLRSSNVDTDQIIPAVYLKRVTKTGFDDALFAGWRKDENFILNQEPYKHGSVLVAGPDFGTGSSREHAVWVLEVNGINVVVAESFARIFRQNMFNCGILAVELEKNDLDRLFNLQGKVSVAVDLDTEKLIATSDNGVTVTCSFNLNPFDKQLIAAGGWLAYADAKY